MRRRVAGVAAGVILAGLVGCGGSTSEDGSSGGSGGSAGSTGGSSAGGSGGSGGGVGGSGGSLGGAGGATGGSGGAVSCDELEQRYQMELANAKECNPFIDFEQCTALVPSSLACGCGTYVNAQAAQQLENLKELAAEWNAHYCGGDILCEPCPPPPLGGSCQPNAAGSGTCLDVL